VFKINKIFIFLIIFCFPVNAHVDHYTNLNRVEFDIYRNNNHIGKHIYSIEKNGSKLLVKSEINFKIKKFGVVIYKYLLNSTEIFENGVLTQFNSTTQQNKKQKYVNMKLENNQYIIDGSSYKGTAPVNYMPGTWWNHSIVSSKAQISPSSGRIIDQNVKFLGKEKIKIGQKTLDTLHFNFTSSDEKLSKDKKLNMDIWYDENTLIWVKAFFKKKGEWEYRLVVLD